MKRMIAAMTGVLLMVGLSNVASAQDEAAPAETAPVETAPEATPEAAPAETMTAEEAPRAIRIDVAGGIDLILGDSDTKDGTDMSFHVMLEAGYMFMPNLSAHLYVSDTFLQLKTEGASASLLVIGAGVRYEMGFMPGISGFGELNVGYARGTVEFGDTINTSGYAIIPRVGAIYMFSPMIGAQLGIAFEMINTKKDSFESKAQLLAIDAGITIRL
jgi:hypothetical protein